MSAETVRADLRNGALIIDTVAELVAAIGARQIEGDNEGVLLLARIGAWRVVDRDLDSELAHSGIYWDAPDAAEIAYADRIQADALQEHNALMRCLPICIAYDNLCGSEELREYRDARLPEPVEEEEDA
ncbi:hypothetical protein [Methylobacterium sp. J-070]|uniref:hypothetical protein n=1 Tax=Methylobacterium sp. J-070 TaxID=2836650 RepID=UPI001FBA3E8C|nr:hypothetical protein [Methylobacterium sp. J-070]MCJ2048795.1 hypothetical protein [Methylobacterium sp. J-070]